MALPVARPQRGQIVGNDARGLDASTPAEGAHLSQDGTQPLRQRGRGITCIGAGSPSCGALQPASSAVCGAQTS